MFLSFRVSVVVDVSGWLVLNTQGGIEGAKGLRRKVWTLRKILGPNIRFFVAILRFVAIYALFWKSSGKKVPFGSKTVLLGQKIALLYG